MSKIVFNEGFLESLLEDLDVPPVTKRKKQRGYEVKLNGLRVGVTLTSRVELIWLYNDKEICVITTPKPVDLKGGDTVTFEGLDVRVVLELNNG